MRELHGLLYNNLALNMLKCLNYYGIIKWLISWHSNKQSLHSCCPKGIIKIITVAKTII